VSPGARSAILHSRFRGPYFDHRFSPYKISVQHHPLVEVNYEADAQLSLRVEVTGALGANIYWQDENAFIQGAMHCQGPVSEVASGKLLFYFFILFCTFLYFLKKVSKK